MSQGLPPSTPPASPRGLPAPYLLQVIGEVDDPKVLGMIDDMDYLLNDTSLSMDNSQVQWRVSVLVLRRQQVALSREQSARVRGDAVVQQRAGAALRQPEQARVVLASCRRQGAWVRAGSPDQRPPARVPETHLAAACRGPAVRPGGSWGARSAPQPPPQRPCLAQSRPSAPRPLHPSSSPSRPLRTGSKPRRRGRGRSRGCHLWAWARL